jgi:hypothetical protein
MEHPLIGSIDHLTEDELTAKISELNNKLNIVSRSGNTHLCNQIRMAIDTYRGKYQEKLQSTYKKEVGDNNFNDKINIK